MRFSAIATSLGRKPARNCRETSEFGHMRTVGAAPRSAGCEVKCANVGRRDDSEDAISEPIRPARARLVAALTAAVQEGHAAGDRVMVEVALAGLARLAGK